MSNLESYLEQIRKLNGFHNAILCEITIHKKTATAEFFLVTDKAYTLEEERQALAITKGYLPDGLTPKMKIVKRVPDEDIIKQKILQFVLHKFPTAGVFLDEESIHVEPLESGAHFYMDIASGQQGLFTSGKILDEVSAYLQSGFCGSFYGNVRIVEKEKMDEKLLDEIPETEETLVEEIRRFPIRDFCKLDGVDTIPTHAVYVADMEKADDTFSICGKVTHIEERTYVKHNEKTDEDEEKSRFSLTISDTTGFARTTYFPKKATVEKVRKIKVGDSIVLTGTIEEFKGHRSFKTAKINYGELPEGFTPVARKGKPVPKAYHTVFPTPYIDYTQTGLFDSLEKPQALKQATFVVFDLETTGLNNQPAMGKMDKIIEIGAVKMVEGELVEKFSTFVACDERLSPEIIKLTGITDADLIGAPTIEKAIADFHKFTDGAILVGHNVMFDYRFIQYYGEQNGYMFDKKLIDTLSLSQEALRGELPNYKLNTVADYFHFTFQHHRAFDDACVTAKIFIELTKKLNKLPL